MVKTTSGFNVEDNFSPDNIFYDALENLNKKVCYLQNNSEFLRNYKDKNFINFRNLSELTENSLVFILINEDFILSQEQELQKLDNILDGIISDILNNKKLFTRKLKETYNISTKIFGKIFNTVLVGTGKNVKLFEFQEIGGIVFNIANKLSFNSLSLLFPENLSFEIDKNEALCLVASGMEESSYRFSKYQNIIDNNISNVNIYSKNSEIVEKKYNFYKAINQGIFLLKDCANEPANVLYPDSYAKIIINEFSSYSNISVEVLGEDEMKNLDMNLILGVGKGSYKESKLVTIKYDGINNNIDYIALVGKGITFDSGGISIKASLDMDKMKYDMTGSACVIGTIKALAERSAKVNVVGIVALVENMPGGNSQRPGDIVKSMSGKTVEILNTDAEGRLILADALTYVQKKFAPKVIIDLATLTGAIGVALGNVYAGCFSNNDNLSNKLIEAGIKVNERIWRMPLSQEYHDMIKSDFADVANLSSGTSAGACTAAAFLEKFINAKVDWSYLDIASVSFNVKGQKGASGFGVKLLNQFIYDNYENQD